MSVLGVLFRALAGLSVSRQVHDQKERLRAVDWSVVAREETARAHNVRLIQATDRLYTYEEMYGPKGG